MEKNYALIIIDYYVSMVENGFSKTESKERTNGKMMDIRNNMTRDDYLKTYELVTRLADA